MESATVTIVSLAQRRRRGAERHELRRTDRSAARARRRSPSPGSQPIATYLTCLRSVTYGNTSQNPNPTARMVNVVVNDGSLASNIASKQVNVLPVNDAPVVVNETLDVLGNTELRVDMVAGTTPHTSETTSNPNAVEGVLDNDADPEGNPFAVTGIANCTVGGHDAAVRLHARRRRGHPRRSQRRVQLHARTGGYCRQLHLYGHRHAARGRRRRAAPARSRFTILDRIWYVDADAPAGGDGTSRLPFNTFTPTTLSGANGAGDLDDADDYIFVYNATAAISSGIELEAGQHLIGEHAGLSIPRNLNGNGSPTLLVPAVAGARPVINGGAGNSVTVTEALPAEITGLTLGSVKCDRRHDRGALPAVASLTIANNVINGATAEGIDVNLNTGTTGTLTLAITGNSWNPAGTHTGNAVDITRAAGTLNLNFSGNTNILSNATAVVINGGAAANTFVTGFASNSIHGNTAGAGVSIANATFDAVPGGAADTGQCRHAVHRDQRQSGRDRRARAQPRARKSVVRRPRRVRLDLGRDRGWSQPDGGAGREHDQRAQRRGRGFQHRIARPSLDQLDREHNGRRCVAQRARRRVAVQRANGQQHHQGERHRHGVSVTSGSNVAVAYAGSLNVTPGAESRSLATTPPPTFPFNGGIRCPPARNAAVSPRPAPARSTSATRTRAVPPQPERLVNTLTTTTGTALNVANTTIGAEDLTFRSISANGARQRHRAQHHRRQRRAHGDRRRLDDAGLFDRDGSGGTITATTGHAVSLTNANNVTLRQMNITNTAANADGINGSGGGNFTLLGALIDNPGGHGINLDEYHAASTTINQNTIDRGLQHAHQERHRDPQHRTPTSLRSRSVRTRRSMTTRRSGIR